MGEPVSPKIVYSDNGHVLFWCHRKEQQMPKQLCLTKYFKRDRKCRACLGLKPRQHWPEVWNKLNGGKENENRS
jgi:hypothetical protein